MKLFRTIKKIMKHENKQYPQDHSPPKEPLTISLMVNIQKIKDCVGSNSDVVIRKIHIGTNGNIQAAILYTDGLADTKFIHDP